MIKLNYYGQTEQGIRARNEDSFLIFLNKYGSLISVVADGMGGHKGGDIASKSVVKMVKKELVNVNFMVLGITEIKKLLLSTIRKFQKDLTRVGEEFPELKDMGSTLNLNVFVDNIMYTINIGDSRTQLFIKKKIISITEDHNLATLAKKDERYAHYAGKTNMLTSSLGPKKATTADFFVTNLENKMGYILMSSDGVHNFISDIKLMKLLKSKSMTVEEKVKNVIGVVKENKSNDNMTFILINYERQTIMR